MTSTKPARKHVLITILPDDQLQLTRIARSHLHTISALITSDRAFSLMTPLSIYCVNCKHPCGYCENYGIRKPLTCLVNDREFNKKLLKEAIQTYNVLSFKMTKSLTSNIWRHTRMQ